MPIPAIPIVVGVLAGAGGLSLGALIRQPQVDKLKTECSKLQEELDQMQALVEDVLKDIELLKLKMQLQQNEDLLEQLTGRDELDIGLLVYAYGLKEYLEIKQNYLVDAKDITETEAVFVDAFAMFLDNRITDDDKGLTQKRFIREYLMDKYSAEIKNLTPPDLNAVITTLEGKIKEAKEKAVKKNEAKAQAEKPQASSFTGVTLADALSWAWLDLRFSVAQAQGRARRKASKKATVQNQKRANTSGITLANRIRFAKLDFKFYIAQMKDRTHSKADEKKK